MLVIVKKDQQMRETFLIFKIKKEFPMKNDLYQNIYEALNTSLNAIYTERALRNSKFTYSVAS